MCLPASSRLACRRLAAGFALALAALAPAHASLVGTSVDVLLDAPAGLLSDATPISLFDPVTVVTPGAEVAAGSATNIGAFMLPGEFINFEASTITVRVAAGDELNDSPVPGFAAGARYVFSGLGLPAEQITGFTAIDGVGFANFSASWIALADPHTVSLNLADMVFVDPGTGSANAFGVVTIGLALAPIPEPSAWLLLAAGLGALALVARRRVTTGMSA